ncbi:MAG: hypothetical protein R2849_08495 [Thermomicrobiales bacterium]
MLHARHPELDRPADHFRAAAVGYEIDGSVRHALPPLPVPYSLRRPALHAIRGRRSLPETEASSSLLAFQGDVSAEQLIAAHLRWVDRQLDDNHGWLRDACRLLARLMRQDYDRLVLILETVDPDR